MTNLLMAYAMCIYESYASYFAQVWFEIYGLSVYIEVMPAIFTGTIWDLWTLTIPIHWLIRQRKCKIFFPHRTFNVVLCVSGNTIIFIASFFMKMVQNNCMLWKFYTNRFCHMYYLTQVLEPGWCICRWCWTCRSSLALFSVLAQGL